jgi:hypothetical protein
VKSGTELPDDLILVHEFRDHYSLQARKEMIVEGRSFSLMETKMTDKAVQELNTKITDFLTLKGERLTKKEWHKRYPKATERA